MTAQDRAALISRYKQGFSEVKAALEGFPAAQLNAHPIPGKWSAAEIVHHLADSESESALRLRRLLTQRHPVIQGYDQDEWARRLDYGTRPLGPALDAFRAARENTAQILDAMSDDDWARQGWHTESGAYSAERWLEIYARHAHGHAEQIRRLREALGSV